VDPLTIYCNADLLPPAVALLRQEVGPHHLVIPTAPVRLGQKAAADPALAGADVAFGQPEVEQVLASPRLRWVQLASAGYTSFDREDVRATFRGRGAVLTKSSLVYDEPCAEHVLAFMCAQARLLPEAMAAQRGARGWAQRDTRQRSRLLREQSAVIVGFGSIGRRLVELLAPLAMRVSALRRRVAGDEAVPTFAVDDPRAAAALAGADHVIDLLPGSRSTERFFDAARLGALKPGAIFYNVGRGGTVDQEALRALLISGRLGAAYLDVTTPEPLPPDHPLWSTPNCFITPHSAGGHDTENERQVRLFLENLRRFTAGEPLLDRVV
jgi:phosphoglycerate dehydrogenase-like enzyme